MKDCLGYGLVIVMLAASLTKGKAQYGFSEFAQSRMFEVTDSSLALIDRQLSGDTTVIIGGVQDSIRTRCWNQPGNSKAAQFILEKFTSYSLDAAYQQYDGDGFNVIATLQGLVYPNQEYIICAHYDDMPTGPIAPGADDNASGTSAVLEAARVLSPHAFDYTLKFIAFDEEETGLIGSRSYADTAYKYGKIIKGVLNLDMIAWDANDDYEMSVSVNPASLPLLGDFTDILRIFRPAISPHIITNTNSDHSSFWNRGYQALLAIEEYPGDFQPYYHTVNDAFDNIDRQYFLELTRGAVATMATLGKNYRMNLSHQPLDNNRNTNERTASLIISSPHPTGTGTYSPRLYFRIDDEEFDFINAHNISGDTMQFSIPGQLPGTKISYYFAAQDSAGEYCVTLPEGGKGLNPPGSVPPPLIYSYYILNDTTVTTCATGLPMNIPGNQIVYKTLNLPHNGRLLDINVKLSITHYSDKDINLYLVSPSGREVMLSTKNGTTLDHYTNTIFDDEAMSVINQAYPPYNGTFRPEKPLSAFDDTVTGGAWKLKIRNAAGSAGSLTQFCLIMTYSDDCYYVDAGRPVSGNGLSWRTAFKTISEAADIVPQPGKLVLIKPGVYHEGITITSNGDEIIPLITGVSISGGNSIQFPQPVNLSAVNLNLHPGEYYACIFRSRDANNGCYPILGFDDAFDYVIVNSNSFIDEEGAPGDSSRLSASIVRPVIYMKHASDPVAERVIVDKEGEALTPAIIFIGDSIGNGLTDALPASYNFIDGIDLTGSSMGEGVRIQNSSFNIFSNSRIYELNGSGIRVNGNASHPAIFNLLSGNEIFNTQPEAVYIGAGDLPEFNNHSDFTHVTRNSIYVDSVGDYVQMERAVYINGNNRGTCLYGNQVQGLVLANGAAIDVQPEADLTLISGNVFKDISAEGSGISAILKVAGNIDSLEVSNNITFDIFYQDNGLYAFRIDATSHHNSFLAHNTVYNLENAFLLEDYGEFPEFRLFNNIVHVQGQYFTSMGMEGRYQVSNNFYNRDPAPEPAMPYFSEPGRQVGDISFVDPMAGDFHPKITDHWLVCNGLAIHKGLGIDCGKSFRDLNYPDIGALELENKIIWTGLFDENWNAAGNWNLGHMPLDSSNVVILPAANVPLLDTESEIRGLQIKPGAILELMPGSQLKQMP